MEITCFDCYYHEVRNNKHLCFGKKYATEIDPNNGCEEWKHKKELRTYSYEMCLEKESTINTIELYFNTVIKLSETVNCNNCKGREACLFKPEPGELIRYNCAIPVLLNMIKRIEKEK